MAESLSFDEKINIETNVKPFGLFPIIFDGYNIPKNKQNNGFVSLYHKGLKYFMQIMIIRSLIVLWFDDERLHWLLGYNYKTHPYLHWLVIFYLFFTYSIYYIGSKLCQNHQYTMEFMEVFKLLNGTKMPQELGTNIKITETLARYARNKMATARYCIGARTVIGSIVFASIYLDNEALGRYGISEVDYYSVGWAVILTIFVFISSGIMYLTTNMLDILGKYFRLRYHKVNQDIETIITARESSTTQVKVVELMRQILVEHDTLCWKLDHYNRYWSLIILTSFALQPTIFVYTMYEICFMWQSWGALALLWALCLESAYLFTRIFLCGVALADEVHHIYLRAVRASFGKYPLDLRLQIRIFIQRISGQTISWYCYDLFGLSRHTFYHALVHMGQNFFLIIDFVVSHKQAREMIAAERAARAAAAATAMVTQASGT